MLAGDWKMLGATNNKTVGPCGVLRRDYPFNNPLAASGLQARYNIADLSSLVYDGSNRVQLVSDVSGNSNVNALVLNGVAGNYASAPDSAAVSVTGDIDIRVRVAQATRAAAALVSKWASAAQISYFFRINNSSGQLALECSADGSTTYSFTSDANIGAATEWVRVTLDVDNGAGGKTATFYTSPDGVTWNILGTAQTTATPSAIFDSTSPVEIGSRQGGTSFLGAALIYRAQIYNGINGTLVFDANFTSQPKLATSFTESSVNAATVTINTTGDLGARICGARDLVQMTVSKQPVLTIGAKNFLTFDGTNDYMKAAPFPLVQPETVYFVGSQVTWTGGDYIFDGASAANTLGLVQTTTTPQLNINAGSSVAANTDLAVNTRGVVSAVYSGANSLLRVNRNVATTGNAGTASPNGFTLGANGASTAANFGNITFSEANLYNTAHGTDLQNALINGMMARWGIAP